MTIPNSTRIGVVGAGAVGCYFGGMLARAGAHVTLLRRPQSGSPAAPIAAPLHIDSIHFQQSVPVHWTHDPVALRDSEIILFCVKAQDNETAAQQIAPHLAPNAIVVSLQNGVDNVERLRAAAQIDALPCVVYVAAGMSAPDRVKHNGRGDLVIGEFTAAAAAPASPRVERVAALFESAGVKCVPSPNIAADLWSKLMMNCAGNAITAIAQCSYGRVAAHEPSRAVVTAIINECIAVARSSGVTLHPIDHVAAAIKLATALGDATSSTAQDLARGKRTEVDALNGYIARRGAQLNIPTPVNSTLWALLKLLEEK